MPKPVSKKMPRKVKTAMQLLSIVVAALAISVFTMVFYLIRISGYEKTDAKITYVHTREYADPDNAQNTKVYTVTYVFLYNGERYYAEKRVVSTAEIKVGDAAYVRCDPKNPREIADYYFIRTGCEIIVFLILCTVVFAWSESKQISRGLKIIRENAGHK